MGEVIQPDVRPRPDEIEVHLVPLRRRHLRAVLRIEAQVYPRPWSLPLFMSELNLRTSRHYVAARIDGIVVGYAGLMYSQVHNGLAYEYLHTTSMNPTVGVHVAF